MAMGTVPVVSGCLLGCASAGNTNTHPVVINHMPVLVVAGGAAVPGKHITCTRSHYTYVWGVAGGLWRDHRGVPDPYLITEKDVGHVFRCVDHVTGAKGTRPLHKVARSEAITVTAR